MTNAPARNGNLAPELGSPSGGSFTQPVPVSGDRAGRLETSEMPARFIPCPGRKTKGGAGTDPLVASPKVTSSMFGRFGGCFLVQDISEINDAPLLIVEPLQFIPVERFRIPGGSTYAQRVKSIPVHSLTNTG